MVSELIMGELLGYGSFGEVHAATWYGKKVAVKSSLSFKPSSYQSLEAEECTLQHLAGCDHIVSMFGSVVSADNLVYHLIIERLSGDLQGYIRREGGRLKEDQARFFARTITEGLAFIHSKGYVHCDIKPENLLLTFENAHSPLRVKISDFGLAKKVGVNVGCRGTPSYMSPEAKNGVCEPPMDIWGLGCVVGEMLADQVSESAENFLEHCLDLNPDTRWTAEKLLQHPFLDTTNLDSGPIPQAGFKVAQPTDSSCILLVEEKEHDNTAAEIIIISDDTNEPRKKRKIITISDDEEESVDNVTSRKKRKIKAQLCPLIAPPFTPSCVSNARS